MTGQKKLTAAAVIFAVLAAFLLVGVSYVLFPDQTSQEPPIPMPTSKPEPLSEQIFGVLPWIGLAACIATAVTGAMLLVSRARQKNR